MTKQSLTAFQRPPSKHVLLHVEISFIMSLSLTSCCPVCKSKEKLLKCQACKAVLYCGRDHQASDRPAHKSACNGVKKAQKIMDMEEAKLRAQPGDMFTPNGARIFEEEAGHFWGILETRPYVSWLLYLEW